MSAIDQVIAQSFLRNQQNLETLPQRFQAGQDAAQMRTMQSQLRQNIDSGASMLEQSPLFAKMATIDPQAAGQMQGLFSTLNKNQVVDTFASIPIALSMSYDEATPFWENKKKEYANNPNALAQIDSIINASPKERAGIYGGMMQMGQDLGVLKGKKESAIDKPFQKGEKGLVFNPNTGEASIDPVYAENLQQLNKITLEQKKAEKALDVETAKAKARAGKQVEQEAIRIQNGLDASQSLSTLKRADKLLDLVGTGKPQQALLWGKKMLGMESANEAELENILGKRVLEQLKPIFGAQFTVTEGQWLKSMEADFGKSTEGNRALIRQGTDLVKQRIAMGKEAAQSAGDLRTLKNMEDWENFKYSDDTQAEMTTGERKRSFEDVAKEYGIKL
jgi:hypothetical protein